MASYLKKQWTRLRTFVVDKILGVHDSPHRIALGVAIGIFVAWTPTIGFQMALTLALSTLLRANKVVGVPLVWISNPATLWIYIPNYILGCRLLGETPSTEKLYNALVKAFGINESGLKERCVTLVQTLWDVLAPLMIGSVIVGGVLGAIAYLATRKGVTVFQARKSKASEAPGVNSAEALPQAKVEEIPGDMNRVQSCPAPAEGATEGESADSSTQAVSCPLPTTTSPVPASRCDVAPAPSADGGLSSNPSDASSAA